MFLPLSTVLLCFPSSCSSLFFFFCTRQRSNSLPMFSSATLPFAEPRERKLISKPSSLPSKPNSLPSKAWSSDGRRVRMDLLSPRQQANLENSKRGHAAARGERGLGGGGGGGGGVFLEGGRSLFVFNGPWGGTQGPGSPFSRAQRARVRVLAVHLLHVSVQRGRHV